MKSKRSPEEQAELDRIGRAYEETQRRNRRFEKALFKAGLYPDREGRYAADTDSL